MTPINELIETSDEELMLMLAKLLGRDPWLKCENHSAVPRDRAIVTGDHLGCPWCGYSLHWEECYPYAKDMNAAREAVSEYVGEYEEVWGGFADCLRDVVGITYPETGSVELLQAGPKEWTIALIRLIQAQQEVVEADSWLDGDPPMPEIPDNYKWTMLPPNGKARNESSGAGQIILLVKPEDGRKPFWHSPSGNVRWYDSLVYILEEKEPHEP